MPEIVLLLLLVTVLSLALSSLRGRFDDVDAVDEHARRVLGAEVA